MNKIIVSSGYMGSGSSAITDLVAEFADCTNEFSSYEYILLHCPNGVFDLEDKLLLGNNALRSDEAIRTFEQQAKKLYDKKFWWVGNYKKVISEQFMDITQNYINSLTDFNYNSYWYVHEEPNFTMLLKLIIKKIIKILTFNKIKFNKTLRYKNEMRISFANKAEFYTKSKEYIYNLIEIMSRGRKNIILDQFLLPFNLHRIDNYFDDKLRVIVVERDPRDVFLVNKYDWKNRGVELPIPTEVNSFCEYYKKMRESEIKCDSDKVLRIKFEDLVYNYESTLTKIRKHLEFSAEQHINKKTKFIPEVSIKNTQLFKDKKHADEVKVIEKKLKKYLYNFPKEI